MANLMEVNASQALRSEAQRELDASLHSMLDRAFLGEL